MPKTLFATNQIAGRIRSGAGANALVVVVVLYALGRIIEVLPFSTPSTPIVALEILSAFTFALIHGTRLYSRRGILVFTALCLVIGNIVENVGVLTGFPYGHYEFLPLMGPQFLHVPVLLGLAYVGMAYVSWTVACLIFRVTGTALAGAQLAGVPLLASFVMTAWDLAQDAVWSTLLHAWRWRDGGLWFGVPLTNFAGWLFTVFLIYLAFAFYVRYRRVVVPTRPASHWNATAVLFYLLCALGNVLQMLRPQPLAVVIDNAGISWHTAAILRVSAVVSIFVMGGFAFLAWYQMRRIQGPAIG